MILGLLFLSAHSVMALLGVPFSWWVAKEARIDEELQGEDCSESQIITAGLRRRNTLGIYISHCVYLVGALAMWCLVILWFQDVVGSRWAFGLSLLIGSLRRLAIQSLLLWLSLMSRRDRLRLRVAES